jgi:hypothetical protein
MPVLGQLPAASLEQLDSAAWTRVRDGKRDEEQRKGRLLVVLGAVSLALESVTCRPQIFCGWQGRDSIRRYLLLKW